MSKKNSLSAGEFPKSLFLFKKELLPLFKILKFISLFLLNLQSNAKQSGLKKHGQFIEHFCVSSMLKPITDYLHICSSVMKKYKARVKKCQL